MFVVNVGVPVRGDGDLAQVPRIALIRPGDPEASCLEVEPDVLAGRREAPAGDEGAPA